MRLRRIDRLYWRIWLAVLASLALFTVMAGLAWTVFGERGYSHQWRVFAELSAAVLPPPDAPAAAAGDALAHWGKRLRSDFALYAADGTRIAATADDLPVPSLTADDEDLRMGARGPTFVLHLPDGRYLSVRAAHAVRWRPFGWLGWLILIAVAVGVGAYPAVRRLTRRLEALQASVDRLGRGDLAARVEVRGCDEVARLAASFNDAAARIEQLIASQRNLLANASHELRSPLARVRMAIEMLPAGGDAALERELRLNIAELDLLIDEILLASRLDAQAADGSGRVLEDVDLAALAAEECARAGVAFEMASATRAALRAEARLLRRLIRNLVDNALRHGGGAQVTVSLAREREALALTVCDRGPGIAAAERERVFEPFYRAAGASESSGGVGLGLSLVRSIARRHGGDVRCEARDGGGSCFVVTLPVIG
jgi:signal transduction histidine kinase